MSLTTDGCYLTREDIYQAMLRTPPSRRSPLLVAIATDTADSLGTARTLQLEEDNAALTRRVAELQTQLGSTPSKPTLRTLAPATVSTAAAPAQLALWPAPTSTPEEEPTSSAA